MRTRIGLGFAALFLATAACSNTVFVSSDAGTGEDGGVMPVTGGDGDTGDSGVVDAAPPPNCDTAKLPTDDACVVNDAEGIFVSSSMGSASGNGSKESPVASLDAAIAKAKQASRRVYACAETYAEQVHFVDGVSVFGYFQCNSAWAVDTTKHAKVAAPASPAATATNITTATRVEAVDLVAPDFASGSQSSIALVATGSPALTFKGATIHAGTGGKGADGTPGTALTDSGSLKNGGASKPKHVCSGVLCAIGSGGGGGSNACSGVSGHAPANGGNGGSGGEYQSQTSDSIYWHWQSQTSDPTTAGGPTTWSPEVAQGGAVGGHAGAPGSAGAAGSNGAAGASFGSVSAGAYVPADGTAGLDGAPGQSGGGTGGYGLLYSGDPDFPAASYGEKYGWGESGAGGGAGGCPGLAGTPGQGGGASIAIVAVGSPFVLDTVTIETSTGGAGGASGRPSDPTSGGKGGTGGTYTQAGGDGGGGGAAGVSGNGGGGPSIGIAYNGTKPQTLASTITPGAGGAGVAGRAFVNDGVVIPASADGVSASTYSF